MAKNGLLSMGLLRKLKSNSAHRLRRGASKAADAMNFKFRRRFGNFLTINDSYRTRSTQWRFWRRWGSARAAYPGTSNHGWGKALDVSVGSYWSTTYKWLANNARRYGWVQPSWAKQGGRKEEAWHWEYVRRLDVSRRVGGMQKWLRRVYGYRGGIDRVWGDGTDKYASRMFDQLKRQPNRKKRIKKLQRILRNGGYYKGKIDGKLGSGSKSAYREFRQDFYCGSK